MGNNFVNIFFFAFFLGPFDNSYVSHFYSSNKNKGFGMNASPESAMSPSISSVATSASEVSKPMQSNFFLSSSFKCNEKQIIRFCFVLFYEKACHHFFFIVHSPETNKINACKISVLEHFFFKRT